MTADDLDEGVETLVVDGPFAALEFVVVADVDDAVEGRVVAGDGAHGVGDELAEGAVDGVITDRVPVAVARDVEAGVGANRCGRGRGFAGRAYTIFGSASMSLTGRASS